VKKTVVLLTIVVALLVLALLPYRCKADPFTWNISYRTFSVGVEPRIVAVSGDILWVCNVSEADPAHGYFEIWNISSGEKLVEGRLEGELYPDDVHQVDTDLIGRGVIAWITYNSSTWQVKVYIFSPDKGLVTCDLDFSEFSGWGYNYGYTPEVIAVDCDPTGELVLVTTYSLYDNPTAQYGFKMFFVTRTGHIQHQYSAIETNPTTTATCSGDDRVVQCSPRVANYELTHIVLPFASQLTSVSNDPKKIHDVLRSGNSFSYTTRTIYTDHNYMQGRFINGLNFLMGLNKYDTGASIGSISVGAVSQPEQSIVFLLFRYEEKQYYVVAGEAGYSVWVINPSTGYPDTTQSGGGTWDTALDSQGIHGLFGSTCAIIQSQLPKLVRFKSDKTTEVVTVSTSHVVQSVWHDYGNYRAVYGIQGDTKVLIVDYRPQVQVTITVKDTAGNPVSGAKVEIKGRYFITFQNAFFRGDDYVAVTVSDDTGQAVVTLPLGYYYVRAYSSEGSVDWQPLDAVEDTSFEVQYTTTTPITETVIDIVAPPQVLVNEPFTIQAQLKDINGNPLAGKTLKVYEDNVHIGDFITNSTGWITVTLSKWCPITYTYDIVFAGDPEYGASSNSTTVTVVSLTSTQLTLTPSKTKATVGEQVKLVATLTAGGSPVAGKTVKLYRKTGDSWSQVASATTDDSGQAVFTVSESTETTAVYKAVFEQTGTLAGSESDPVAVAFVKKLAGVTVVQRPTRELALDLLPWLIAGFFAIIAVVAVILLVLSAKARRKGFVVEFGG